MKATEFEEAAEEHNESSKQIQNQKQHIESVEEMLMVVHFLGFVHSLKACLGTASRTDGSVREIGACSRTENSSRMPGTRPESQRISRSPSHIAFGAS